MAQSGRAKYHSCNYPRATLLGRQAPRFSGATHTLIHRDPFDRLLIAQARSESLTLVTGDTEILKYDVTTLAA